MRNTQIISDTLTCRKASLRLGMVDSLKSIQPNSNENSIEIQTSKQNVRDSFQFGKRVQLELTNALKYIKKTVQSTSMFSSVQKSVAKEADEHFSRKSIQIETMNSPTPCLNPSTVDEHRESKESQHFSSRKTSNAKSTGSQAIQIQAEEINNLIDPYSEKIVIPIKSFIRSRAQTRVHLPPPETISKNWQTLKRKFFNQYRFIDKTHQLLDQKMTRTMRGSSITDKFFDGRTWYDRLLILPNSRFKWIWDIIISLNSVLQGISAFYMIGFVEFENNQIDETMLWIFIGLDSMILIDMILCLFTAYYVGPDLVTSPKKIIMRYLKQRMIFDLAMIAPLYRYYIEALAFKTLRIRRWVFLMDQFSALVHYLSSHIKYYQIKFIILVLTRALKTMLWTVIAIHILTCLSSFLVRYFTNKFFLIKEGQSSITGYIQGCYFIVYTMSSVGYGDITISFENNVEIFVGIYLQFIALGVFVFATASISRDFQLFGLKSIRGEEKSGLEWWFFTIEKGNFSSEPMPEAIVRDVEALVMENLQNNLNVLVKNPQYFPKLGPTLRIELTLGVFKEFCETYPFFFDLLERKARAEFLCSLEQKTYLPNTMILNGKQKPDGLYFLRSGMLYTTPPNNHRIFLSRYIDHGIFGEELLTDKATPYGLRTGKRYATCFFLESRKVRKFVEDLRIDKGIIQEQLKLGRLDPSEAFNNMFSVGASLADERGGGHRNSRSSSRQEISSIRPRAGTKLRRDAKIMVSENIPKFSNMMPEEQILDDIKVELQPRRRASTVHNKAPIVKKKTKDLIKEEKNIVREDKKTLSEGLLKGLLKLPELPEIPYPKTFIKPLENIQTSITSMFQKFVENPFQLINKAEIQRSSLERKVSETTPVEEEESEKHAIRKIEESKRNPKDRGFEEEKKITPMETSIDNLLEESKLDIYSERSILVPQNLQAANISSFKLAELDAEVTPFSISHRDISIEPAFQPKGEDYNLQIEDPEGSSKPKWFQKKRSSDENIVNRSRQTVFTRTEYKSQTKKDRVKNEKRQSHLDLLKKAVLGVDTKRHSSKKWSITSESDIGENSPNLRNIARNSELSFSVKEEEIRIEEDEEEEDDDDEFETDSEGSSDEDCEDLDENALNRSIDTPITYFYEENEDPENVKDIEEYAKFLKYKLVLIQRKFKYFKSTYKQMLKEEYFALKRLRPRKMVLNV